jgi:hypothetical protein
MLDRVTVMMLFGSDQLTDLEIFAKRLVAKTLEQLSDTEVAPSV